jgi:wobble nucleotide-excising tRNase
MSEDIQNYQEKIATLEKERNDAIAEANRYRENLRFQENLNKHLQKKDAEAQTSIKKLTQQLGNHISTIYN